MAEPPLRFEPLEDRFFLLGLEIDLVLPVLNFIYRPDARIEGKLGQPDPYR